MTHPTAPNSLNCCAVIVTHTPDSDFDERCFHLLEQLHHIYIIDTGSEPDMLERLRKLGHKDPRITFIPCSENNLAKAQNMGIDAARSENFAWVLLMDDDSNVSDGYIKAMKAAYEQADDKAHIGLIAPNMVDRNTQRHTHFIKPFFKLGFRTYEADKEVLDGVLFVIASGSLIPMHSFNRAGAMDESYIIDYIDKEFCLRLNQLGLRILVTPHATLSHSIGKCEDHELFGKRITATNHCPQRRYTIYRNRLRTIARYCLSCPAFATHDILAMGYDILRICLFESHKAEKLRAIGLGVCNAVTGSTNHPSWSQNER